MEDPEHESSPHRVVVGVDGSTGSRAAVDLAADEARARHLPLHLVYGYFNPMVATPLTAMPLPSDVTGLVEPTGEARDVMADLAADVRRRHRDLHIVAHTIAGQPAAVLIDQSYHADLVVVGARGHGGFTELLAGSVAVQVATHAHCPVIVVRHHQSPTPAGPVVVGIDDTAESGPAIEYAFAEADRRDVTLRVVHAWTTPGHDEATARDQAERLLAEAVAGWHDTYPDIAVERALSHEIDPVTTLVNASDGASLVVVGSRGRGQFASLLLGSVGYALIHHAHCPVAIIRTATTKPTDPPEHETSEPPNPQPVIHQAEGPSARS